METVVHFNPFMPVLHIRASSSMFPTFRFLSGKISLKNVTENSNLSWGELTTPLVTSFRKEFYMTVRATS